jgi:hypothetical protein
MDENITVSASDPEWVEEDQLIDAMKAFTVDVKERISV